MCERAVEEDPWSLLHDGPNWFVTQEQVKLWRSDDYYCNDGETVE